MCESKFLGENKTRTTDDKCPGPEQVILTGVGSFASVLGWQQLSMAWLTIVISVQSLFTHRRKDHLLLKFLGKYNFYLTWPSHTVIR